jgi:hypothetical protein
MLRGISLADAYGAGGGASGTPHRHLRLRRLRRLRGLSGLLLGSRYGQVGPGVVLPGLVRRGQHFADPRAGDGPLLSFPLGHGRFGLDTAGLLPQLLHATASTSSRCRRARKCGGSLVADFGGRRRYPRKVPLIDAERSRGISVRQGFRTDAKPVGSRADDAVVSPDDYRFC